MEINWTSSAVNFVLLITWLVLPLIALLRLRHSGSSDTSRVLWALVILLIPFLGPVAFLLAGAEPRQQRKA